MQSPVKSTAKGSGCSIRPTSDRAREALFSIIGREVENAAVLDLYAGTGALGLEALSRSAGHVVFVDNSQQAIKLIYRNIELCGFSDRTLVLKRDLSKGLSFLKKQFGTTFSIVFVDAPYRKGLSVDMLKELAGAGLILPEGLIVVEEDAFAELPAEVAGLTLVDQRRYGDSGFWFYRQHDFRHNQ